VAPMHSIYQRLNIASALLSSCLFGLLACIAVTSYLQETSPQGTLTIDSVKVMIGKVRYNPVQQHTAHIKFDFDADMTSLFHWNTKQVFLYLEAEYTNTKGTYNEVVFWDKIIRRKRDANVHVRGKNKYIMKDINRSFSNSSSVMYHMKYNIMPWVGPLQYGVVAKAGPTGFPAPEKKV